MTRLSEEVPVLIRLVAKSRQNIAFQCMKAGGHTVPFECTALITDDGQGHAYACYHEVKGRRPIPSAGLHC